MKNLFLCTLLIFMSSTATFAQDFFKNMFNSYGDVERSFVIATSPNVTSPTFKLEAAISNRIALGLKSKLVLSPMAIEKPAVFGRFYPKGTAPEGTYLEANIGLKRPIQIGDQVLIEKGTTRHMSVDLGHQILLGNSNRIALEVFGGIEWNNVDQFKEIFSNETPLHLGLKVGLAL